MEVAKRTVSPDSTNGDTGGFSCFSDAATRIISLSDGFSGSGRGSGALTGSSGSSGSSLSSAKTQFPDTLTVNGQPYRLAHASSDTATYYNPKTGVRTTVRNTDLPGYD